MQQILVERLFFLLLIPGMMNKNNDENISNVRARMGKLVVWSEWNLHVFDMNYIWKRPGFSQNFRAKFSTLFYVSTILEKIRRLFEFSYFEPLPHLQCLVVLTWYVLQIPYTWTNRLFFGGKGQFRVNSSLESYFHYMFQNWIHLLKTLYIRIFFSKTTVPTKTQSNIIHSPDRTPEAQSMFYNDPSNTLDERCSIVLNAF